MSGCGRPATLLRQRRRPCGHLEGEPFQYCTEHGRKGNVAPNPSPCRECHTWNHVYMSTDGGGQAR